MLPLKSKKKIRLIKPLSSLNLLQIALTHHAKINKWFQIGGHADGESDLLNVALREVEEETGLKNLKLVKGENIFDIDVHEIAERKRVPKHLHYELRYLIKANIDEEYIVSHESKDLKWIKLTDVHKYNSEHNVLKMVEKALLI